MNEPMTPCNGLILLATAIVSYLGFRNQALERKLIFNPESILADKEYYRLVSSAFLHANWQHLLLNLICLYSFGGYVESTCGIGQFLLIYFGSILGGSLLSLLIHRHHDYRAYGASGGVCGVMFSYLLLSPSGGVQLYFFLPVPGWLFAIGFLIGSFFALKQGRDNVGHDAHLGGAILGLLVTAALHPETLKYNGILFGIILAITLALIFYTRATPLWIPSSRWPRPALRISQSTSQPKHKQEERAIDAILEKIGRDGIHSLTAAEKALLEATSAKYQRRAEPSKRKSDLAI